MRFRLITLAITLAGFLVINYLGNERGQALILSPEVPGFTSDSADEMKSLQQATEAYAQIGQALAGTRAMLDTLEAMGVRTSSSDELRQWNRAGLEKFEQLRMAFLLSQIIWRQTIANLLWAVFTTAILFPAALLLDRQYPGRQQKSAGEPEPADSGPLSDDE